MTSSQDMTCHELMPLVTDYLEGALRPQDRARFEAHRDACRDCAAHVAQVRHTVSLLGHLHASPEPSADLSEGPAQILDLFRAHGLHRPHSRIRDIPLGFGGERVAPGDHIAYFWESEREFDAMAGFLAAGVSLGDACVLIGQDAANQRVLVSLERLGLSVSTLMEARELQVASVHESADALLLELGGRISDAVHRGMPVVRILGNLNQGRGTPRWPSDREILRLEAHVTNAAQRLPSIVVCAYDVNSLPGPLLVKGGMECHPLTFRRDHLRHNEHHVSPKRFLEDLAATGEHS